jgi:hypothetical protein
VLSFGVFAAQVSLLEPDFAPLLRAHGTIAHGSCRQIQDVTQVAVLDGTDQANVHDSIWEPGEQSRVGPNGHATFTPSTAQSEWDGPGNLCFHLNAKRQTRKFERASQ